MHPHCNFELHQSIHLGSQRSPLQHYIRCIASVSLEVKNNVLNVVNNWKGGNGSIHDHFVVGSSEEMFFEPIKRQ